MRRLFLFISVLGALCIPVAAASAQSYQLDGLSTTTPTPGQSIHVHGNGFAPSSSVAVVETCGSTKTTIGSLTASASDGTVDGDVVLPASTPAGKCTLSLVGTNPDGTPRVLDFSITVAGTSTSTSSGVLPFTGAAVGPMIAAGVGAIMLGFSLASARRRRRTLV